MGAPSDGEGFAPAVMSRPPRHSASATNAPSGAATLSRRREALVVRSRRLVWGAICSSLVVLFFPNAFAPFVRPATRSDPTRHDRGRSVS
jgi:hypothetical protein